VLAQALFAVDFRIVPCAFAYDYDVVLGYVAHYRSAQNFASVVKHPNHVSRCDAAFFGGALADKYRLSAVYFGVLSNYGVI
jgi:hypothetical protein